MKREDEDGDGLTGKNEMGRLGLEKMGRPTLIRVCITF